MTARLLQPVTHIVNIRGLMPARMMIQLPSCQRPQNHRSHLFISVRSLEYQKQKSIYRATTKKKDQIYHVLELQLHRLDLDLPTVATGA